MQNGIQLKISTHTSRVGCDKKAGIIGTMTEEFLLTHPVWDVTWRIAGRVQRRKFLLTHPVWDVTWDVVFFRAY